MLMLTLTKKNNISMSLILRCCSHLFFCAYKQFDTLVESTSRREAMSLLALHVHIDSFILYFSPTALSHLFV